MNISEDIFKPAEPEELNKRKKDRAQEIQKNMYIAKCSHCGALIKKVGVTEVWNGYATITSSFEWKGGSWDSGEPERDYGEGDSEYQCGECGTEVDFEALGIPFVWDCDSG